MDWKTIAVVLALAIVLTAAIFVQVSTAAGGGNNSSMKNQSGNNTQSSKSNQSARANNTSAKNNTGQSEGYVPLGGLAGIGSKVKGAGPHEKGWMGAPANNPWTYGPSVYPRRQAQNLWKNLNTPAPNSSTGTSKT